MNKNTYILIGIAVIVALFGNITIKTDVSDTSAHDTGIITAQGMGHVHDEDIEGDYVNRGYKIAMNCVEMFEARPYIYRCENEEVVCYIAGTSANSIDCSF